jgi:hypothetical protein
MSFKHFPIYIKSVLDAAGTPERLTSAQSPCRGFSVEAAVGNTGVIRISSGTSEMSSGAYTELNPGDMAYFEGSATPIGFQFIDPYDYYFDGATTGNAVIIQYNRNA